MATVDVQELDSKVQALYRQIAAQPRGAYHFEVGRSLAERLGYPTQILDLVPGEAVESFAGVGYFFDLAALRDGERVLDLGSGSGTDAFVAAAHVGPTGRVIGVDFTAEQLAKARRIVTTAGLAQVEFREGRIEDPPAESETFDCVISNGVINLSPNKQRVFTEAAHLLRPGGRLAIADIVTERELTEPIVCDADLWASCIGGAAQQDWYRGAIQAAGLRIRTIRENPYEFVSRRARNASVTYGVKSISLLAVKPGR
jgi:arsenite methyltransferase